MAKPPPKVSGLLGGTAPVHTGVSLGQLTQRIGAKSAPEAMGPQLRRVPLSLIDESPTQNRVLYDEGALDALGQTLERHQIEPIVLRRKSDDRFELVAGHRRCRAASLRGMPDLLALVYSDGEASDDEQVAFDVLVSNEQRETLSDFERAIGYQGRVSAGFRQAEVARRLGISEGLVSKRLAYFKLPKQALDALSLYPNAFSHRFLPDILEALKLAPELVDELAAGIVAMGVGEIGQDAFVRGFLARCARQSVARGDQAPKQNAPAADFSVVCSGRPVCNVRMPSKGKKDVIIRTGAGIDPQAFALAVSQLIELHKEDLERQSGPRNLDTCQDSGDAIPDEADSGES